MISKVEDFFFFCINRYINNWVLKAISLFFLLFYPVVLLRGKHYYEQRIFYFSNLSKLLFQSLKFEIFSFIDISLAQYWKKFLLAKFPVTKHLTNSFFIPHIGTNLEFYFKNYQNLLKKFECTSLQSLFFFFERRKCRRMKVKVAEKMNAVIQISSAYFLKFKCCPLNCLFYMLP